MSDRGKAREGSGKGPRFCGALISGKGNKLVSCTTSMFLLDGHSKCYKCRGGECIDSPCVECASWSPKARYKYVREVTKAKQRKARKKLSSPSASATLSSLGVLHGGSPHAPLSTGHGSFLDQEGDDGVLLDPTGLLESVAEVASPLGKHGGLRAKTLSSDLGQSEDARFASHAPPAQEPISVPGQGSPSSVVGPSEASDNRPPPFFQQQEGGAVDGVSESAEESREPPSLGSPFPLNPQSGGPPSATPGLARAAHSAPPGFELGATAFPGGNANELFQSFLAFLGNGQAGVQASSQAPHAHSPGVSRSEPQSTVPPVSIRDSDRAPVFRTGGGVSVPSHSQPPLVRESVLPARSGHHLSDSVLRADGLTDRRGVESGGQFSGVRGVRPSMISTVSTAPVANVDPHLPLAGNSPIGSRAAGGSQWKGYSIPRVPTRQSAPMEPGPAVPRSDFDSVAVLHAPHRALPSGTAFGSVSQTVPLFSAAGAAVAEGGCPQPVSERPCSLGDMDDLANGAFFGFPSQDTAPRPHASQSGTEEDMDCDESAPGEAEQPVGFSEVLDWLYEAFPHTRPPPTVAPRDQLLNRVLRAQAVSEPRRDVKLSPTDLYGAMDDAYTKLVQGSSDGGKPMGMGHFLSPTGGFSEYYKWRDLPHMASPQTCPSDESMLFGLSPEPNSFSLSAKEFTAMEHLSRRQLLTSNFLEWMLSLVCSLLAGDSPDLSKVDRVIESLARGLNLIQKDAMMTVANFSLKRRDSVLRDLPAGVSRESRAALRSSSFLSPHLFGAEAISRAASELKSFTDRETQLRFMSSLQGGGSRPPQSAGHKRKGGNQQPHQAPKKGRQGSAAKGSQPRASGTGRAVPNPTPPPSQRSQPFRRGASGRGSRGGKRN